mgnify:FL=1|tara:strand:- start:878 stop:1207 length:330 start_codon:yes stop_codon:yes gene_type:complete
MRPVIFYESIVAPPSESGAVRSVCLYGKVFIDSNLPFLLETTQENKDIYYDWIKKVGLTDFIKEIVTAEEQVKGLRISEDKKRDPCLTISRVSLDNLDHIVNMLKYSNF